jgi:hypothetical protein
MEVLSGGSTAQGISSWHDACEKSFGYGTLSLQFAGVEVEMISGWKSCKETMLYA